MSTYKSKDIPKLKYTEDEINDMFGSSAFKDAVQLFEEEKEKQSKKAVTDGLAKIKKALEDTKDPVEKEKLLNDLLGCISNTTNGLMDNPR